MITRLFEERDAEPLTDLLHAAYGELGRMGLNFTAVDQDVATTRARALAGRCWVTTDGDRPVATTTVSLPPSVPLQRLTDAAREPHRAWLNQMAVAPEARGRGLARELWDLGRTWAARSGATSIGVDTAEPAAHLVALYRGWGFAPVGTVHWRGKTYDSLVLVRDLP